MWRSPMVEKRRGMRGHRYTSIRLRELLKDFAESLERILLRFTAQIGSLVVAARCRSQLQSYCTIDSVPVGHELDEILLELVDTRWLGATAPPHSASLVEEQWPQRDRLVRALLTKRSR